MYGESGLRSQEEGPVDEPGEAKSERSRALGASARGWKKRRAERVPRRWRGKLRLPAADRPPPLAGQAGTSSKPVFVSGLHDREAVPARHVKGGKCN